MVHFRAANATKSAKCLAFSRDYAASQVCFCLIISQDFVPCYSVKAFSCYYAQLRVAKTCADSKTLPHQWQTHNVELTTDGKITFLPNMALLGAFEVLLASSEALYTTMHHYRSTISHFYNFTQPNDTTKRTHVPRHPFLWDCVTQVMSSLNILDVASPLKNTLLLNLLRGVVVYWLFPHLEIHDHSQYISRAGLGLGPRLKSKGLRYNTVQSFGPRFK